MLYLTDAADTHVQGISVTTGSIQHLGRQLHHQVLSSCMALEGTRRSGIVVFGEPFIIASLILHIIVSRALLGSEVFHFRRAVLQAEKTGSHIHELVRGAKRGCTASARPTHPGYSPRSHPISPFLKGNSKPNPQL